MVLDGGTLAVESVVGSALEARLAGAVQLAATELTENGRAQLVGASGEHCCWYYGVVEWRVGAGLLCYC